MAGRRLFAFLVAGLSLASGLRLSADQPPRDSMRRLVIDISSYAKEKRGTFLVITQNGNALFDGGDDSPFERGYLDAIDGVGQESLRFGDPEFGARTPAETTEYLLPILRSLVARGKAVLTIDYCDKPYQISDVLRGDAEDKFVAFIAPNRNLETIPRPPAGAPSLSGEAVDSLGEVKNFLYVIDPESYGSKDRFIKALAGTDYDLVIVDAFFDGEALSPDDLAAARRKSSGARRLVLAYMSIGEAEDYRPYWRSEWSAHPPSWIESENPQWKGNYRVKYWDPDWKRILLGSPAAYLDRILAAGFDGVYLDTIDTFYYFEDRTSGAD